MRSQLLVRRTRSLVKAPQLCHRALLSSTRPSRYPRKDTTAAATSVRVSKRTSSSIPSASSEANPEDPNVPPEQQELPEEAPQEEAEKPKRRTRTSNKDAGSEATLPRGLDILWSPDATPNVAPPPAPPSPPNPALPPPEIFHEVLTNLHITLHPQTQHKAAYASSSGPPVEPTLALYCPIEGGDYIIDETVRELGRQTGADIVVLDAVQLAAGECGQFGKAASVLQLPVNPLHFRASPAPSRPPPTSQAMDDEMDDNGGPFFPSSQVTLHVLAPARGRAVLAAPRRGNSTFSLRLKAFFDEIINVGPSHPEGSTEPPPPRRPRIIYIRDLPTLAPSSATWYPPLLAAVRSRRQGPIARVTSPVYNPTTIVFGITPPIVAPLSSSASPAQAGPQGLLSLLMSRHSSPQGLNTGSKVGKSDYSEDEVADKARERRLRDRLRKWERGDGSLQDDLPRLATSSSEADEAGNSNGNPEVMVMGGGQEGISGMPSMFNLAGRGGRGDAPEGERSSRFFRTSVIVPNVRSLIHEKACRVGRRREINELTMRMGVASVGGTLGKMEGTPDEAQASTSEDGGPEARRAKVWEDWGRTVEVWSNVRQIADRAVGNAMAANHKDAKATSGKAGLEPTPVSWPAVYEAWSVHRAVKDLRKAWVQHSTGRNSREQDEGEDEEPIAEEEETDEVVDRVKRDPDLDQHEQRLLGCIVDPASLSTTFNQVHLPAHTIDSVRTIVSLPLLHPTAFQHGILKEHGMTGCLLFGPPGTGKTLVVRALAKEAGCRMMAISPSDVMDMYVGEGEKLVRSVFSLARRLSPCVVFIDEIDALFGARMSARETGSAIAHRGVITEFMQEMDGLKTSKDDNVILIGATNRPFDLDDAVLRRLPRRLLVDLPGEREREEILKILLRDEPLSADVDLKALARKTETFSGSDLKHLCVSAALDAVKERVVVPWRQASSSTNDATSSPSPPAEVQAPVALAEETSEPAYSQAGPEPTSTDEDPIADATQATPARTLHWRNFAVALKEITPSASEALGSLSDLRKWNEEFGEGRKERKKQVWGKGRFGFTLHNLEAGEGKVQPGAPPSV